MVGHPLFEQVMTGQRTEEDVVLTSSRSSARAVTIDSLAVGTGLLVATAFVPCFRGRPMTDDGRVTPDGLRRLREELPRVAQVQWEPARRLSKAICDLLETPVARRLLALELDPVDEGERGGGPRRQVVA